MVAKNGRWLLFGAALVGLLAFSTVARADTVGSFINLGQLNFASDNNAEYLAVDTNGNGRLDAGDVIRGAIDINTLNDTNANLGGATGNHQWSGVFSLMVRDVINITNGGTATERGDILFEPDPGFAAWVATLDTDPGTAGVQAPSGPAVAAGTMARLWTNATPTTDFLTAQGGVDNAVATAAVGTFFWDIGFADESAASHVDAGVIVSDNGEGWVALNGGTNLTALVAAVNTTVLGTGNFGLSLLQAGVGPGLTYQSWDVISAGLIGATAGTPVQIIGSSTVRGALGNEAVAGFHAGSDTNFGFIAVPLPAAVWPGFALLLGLGAARFRRRPEIA